MNTKFNLGFNTILEKVFQKLKDFQGVSYIRRIFFLKKTKENFHDIVFRKISYSYIKLIMTV